MRRLLPFLLAGCCAVAQAESRAALNDLAYGPAPEQRLDLYRPAGPAAAPLLLMVHGGAWQYGDKAATGVVGRKQGRWLPRGIAVASANYRLLPAAPPLDQARDVALALAQLQRRAGELGLDGDSVVLLGHSAGGHLIALLAARPDLLAAAGARPPLGFVVLDSGALNVPAIMHGPHLPLHDRAFGNDPDYWLAISPHDQLRHASAPLQLVCSSLRRHSCGQAEAFAARARNLGGRAEVLALPLSHGDINTRLGDDPAYTAAVERFLATLSPRLAERLR
ncbi:MAG TPA: alpha/beta hydrolase [Azonexus sp.]